MICLGSNADPERHMAEAHRRIAALYPAVRFSPTLQSPAVGIDAAPFRNALARFGTADGYEETARKLKGIEAAMGATKTDKRRGIVAIDLDILLFDGARHHENDWSRPYIERLLREFHTFL